MVVRQIEISPQYNFGMGVLFDDELARAVDFLRFNDLPIWIEFLILVTAASGFVVPTHKKAGADPKAGVPLLDSRLSEFD